MNQQPSTGSTDSKPRRAAPAARPHPIAGYRAQHHHYSQKHIRASGIDRHTQLQLQRALHPSHSFSRLPDTILIAILTFVPPEQLTKTLARVSRRLATLILADQRIWNTKLHWLSIPKDSASAWFQQLRPLDQQQLISIPNTPQENGQDQLLAFQQTSSGTYAQHEIPPEPVHAYMTYKPTALMAEEKKWNSCRHQFMYYYRSLIPFLDSLVYHSTDSLAFSVPGLSALQRAELLATLERFLRNPFLAPPSHHGNGTVARNLKMAADAFEASISRQFGAANRSQDHQAMKALAHIRFALADYSRPGPHCIIVQTFINSRHIFLNSLPFKPLDNLRKTEDGEGRMVEGVDFGGLRKFFDHLKHTIAEDGRLIGQIFPPEMRVLQYFMARLVDGVVSVYTGPLLAAVQALPAPLFLITSVEVYAQLRGLVSAAMTVEPSSPEMKAEDIQQIIHGMFAAHLGTYLQEESAWVKRDLERVCVAWNSRVLSALEGRHHGGPASSSSNLLGSAKDPSLMKKNVLRSFKKALLLPVSVVPKTVSYSFNALSTVGAGAFYSVANGLIAPSSSSASSLPGPHSTDYRNAQILADGQVLQTELESWLDDDLPHDPRGPQPSSSSSNTPACPPDHTTSTSLDGQSSQVNDDHGSAAPQGNLRALLSLDVALQAITVDRQALARLESFLPFNLPHRQKVVDTIEHVFILLLRSLGQDHIQPAFERAFRQMSSRAEDEEKEAAHEGGIGEGMGDFFGLVDVADTVQQMVEVYSEQAGAAGTMMMAQQDFLSPVGREKRGFERRLDELVARGLSLAIDRLVRHLDRLLLRLQRPQDFFPPDDAPVPTSPTNACRALVAHLDAHSRLLSARSDRHVLGVFYQEIALRMHSLLCKHIKRSTISVAGARQLQLDVAHYARFVKGVLPETNEAVDTAFDALVLAASIFAFVAPADLVRFVRQIVGGGGGAGPDPAPLHLGPLSTDDVYQFINSRADWKKIQAVVDREVYGLGVEECTIA
ncbi:hypothetical protein PCANC_08529 [Puccinia coronata f. sp. avenae]|uniref:F-box domain-containing protein n=1 Tax=Puccinia coronata f. sp. avenae TaxID=200324 RepID=A0A2N5V952_9BASI|nr:hypothetical protein PCANC_08529 [Puccinia coronata f. sp. avenae]